MSKESYTGTSGLLDDADITILSAKFGGDPDYMDGEVECLILGVLDEEAGDETKLLFSIGGAWEGADKGTRAVLAKTGEPHPKGFNRNSAIFTWLRSCV